jgi:hypothetical protein
LITDFRGAALSKKVGGFIEYVRPFAKSKNKQKQKQRGEKIEEKRREKEVRVG